MTTLALDKPPLSGRQAPTWAPLAVVLAGTFVTFLDFFIVNVALPSIQTDLHAGHAAVSLVVAGYGLTFAAGMISGGRLGDVHGRRRMFALGLALFTITSAACGLAPTAGVLVAARMLQGAAGALLTPQVLAILGTVYDGARRATAFAAYGFAMGIAGVLGQLLGGTLIQADVLGLGWRMIFLINLPVGVAAWAFVGRVVPESLGVPARVDVSGTLLGTAAITALVLPLVEGREHGWPVWTWLSIAAAPVLGIVFVAHQSARAAAGRPALVDLGLFRARSFSVASLTAMTFAVVPPSFFFVLALYLQQGRGYSALFSGAVFVAVGVGYFAAMTVAQPLAQRLGHQVLAAGAVLVGAGCLTLAAAAQGSSSWELTPGLALAGFGIGLVLVPVSAMALAEVRPDHAGAASGILSTAQQVGGALGVAVIGTVFFGPAQIEHGFVVSLWLIAALTVATALLAQLLRTPRRATGNAEFERPDSDGTNVVRRVCDDRRR
jgi:EmrB/QacA subfamily drug resistance transporter